MKTKYHLEIWIGGEEEELLTISLPTIRTLRGAKARLNQFVQPCRTNIHGFVYETTAYGIIERYEKWVSYISGSPQKQARQQPDYVTTILDAQNSNPTRYC